MAKNLRSVCPEETRFVQYERYIFIAILCSVLANSNTKRREIVLFSTKISYALLSALVLLRAEIFLFLGLCILCFHNNHFIAFIYVVFDKSNTTRK